MQAFHLYAKVDLALYILHQRDATIVSMETERNFMRVTLNIDDELLLKAQSVTGIDGTERKREEISQTRR